MSAAHEIRHEPFWHDALTPQANKAAEMALNGFSVREIGEELYVADGTVSAYLTQARRAGVDLPARMPQHPRVSTAELVAARSKLGASVNVAELLAERFGMERSTVSMRLWRYDQKQKGATP